MSLKHGDAATWLISEAFDLKSGRPLEYERLIEKASKLLEKEETRVSDINKMNDRLIRALGPKDDFLFRWRAICQKRGWRE